MRTEERGLKNVKTFVDVIKVWPSKRANGYVLSSRITDKHDVWGTNAKRILPSHGKSLLHSHWPLATPARPRSITNRSRGRVHMTNSGIRDPPPFSTKIPKQSPFLWSDHGKSTFPAQCRCHMNMPPTRHLTREAMIYGHKSGAREVIASKMCEAQT